MPAWRIRRAVTALFSPGFHTGSSAPMTVAASRPAVWLALMGTATGLVAAAAGAPSASAAITAEAIPAG
jgi:hypothetical protein